jgi:hypothetical protein
MLILNSLARRPEEMNGKEELVLTRDQLEEFIH